MSNPFDDLLAERAARRSNDAKIVARAAVSGGLQPDAAAKQAQIARRYSVAPEVVAGSPTLFEENEAARSIGDIAIRAMNTAKWASQSMHNAAIARDDLDNMAEIENAITSRQKPKSFWEKAAEFGRGIGSGGATASGEGVGGIAVAKLPGQALGAAKSVAAGAKELGLRGAGLELTAGFGDATTSAAGTGAMIAKAFGGGGGRFVGDLLTLGGVVMQEKADEIAPDLQSTSAKGIGSGIRSLPNAGLALLGGAATGSAKVASVLIGASAGGQSFITGKRAGLTDNRATTFATVDGLIEAATEYLPFLSLIGGAGSGFAKRFVKSTLAEIPGEQLATLGQDFNQWASVDANNGKTFDEFLAERPEAAQQTLLATIVGSGAINLAVSAAEKAGAGIQRRYDAQQAEVDAKRLEVLTQFREASKVAARDVGSFEDFVRTAAEDGGEGMTDVYVDAAEFANVFDQSELSPEEIGQLTGLSEEEIAQAVSTGGDLRIPIEVFTARLAAEDVGKQLIPHLRFDPDGMSKTEAQTFMQGAQDEFTAAATEQFDRITATDEERASGTRVLESVAAQLDQTKRFTPEINRGYAALHAAFAVSTGRKLGLTPEEFHQRYGLKVQSGETAAPTFDQGKGRRLYHGGRAGMTAADIQIVGRDGQKQGKKGRKYGGFYATENVEEARGYAAMQEGSSVYNVDLAPNAVVEEKAGDITRLTEEQIAEFRGRGVDVVVGKDPRGRTEYAVLNADVIVGFNAQGKPTVNIGLAMPGAEAGQEMTADRAREALAAAGFKITGDAVHLSDSENTLVAELDRAPTEAEVYALSETLGQEAIAAFTGTEGILAGPQAANWGSFNPEFFVNLDGSRMAEPATFNQSAATLQALPLGVQPTGPGGRVRNRDVGEAFTLRHMATYGRALDPSNADDYATVLDAMVEDYRNQFEQADNGEAWYAEDVAEALRMTELILPELADPVRRDIFLTAAALLSPQQGPVDNWSNAIDAMTGYSVTGRFALEKPSGLEFGVPSHRSGLRLFQHLIEREGEIGALVWLYSEHTGRELAELRLDSGIFTPGRKLQAYLPNETNLNESKLGIYAFGPKVGDFALNSMGADQTAVTVDLWMARTYNRLIGRLMDVPAKIAAEGGLADAMRGRSERDLVKSLVRDAAAQAGIAPSAMQAALWYFEQRLYRNHGIKSESTSFSDAASNALANRGIDPGVRESGVGPAAVDAGEGVVGQGYDAVYNQGSTEQVNPLTLFRRESLYPDVAVQADNGTVYTDAVDFYPDRLARIAEQLGVPAVVAVEAGDVRLKTGTPLWHTAPVVDSAGRMVLDHWGPAGLSESDPTRWGESGTAPRSERQMISSGLPRTYFGIASGQPGGYIIEFPGRTRYTARIPADRVYDIGKDPAKLKGKDGVPALERRIKDAGYAGYWSNNDQLGLVATIFEPTALEPHQPAAYFQDQIFYSALGRAVEQTKTTKAPAAQWIATLKKTPGVKQEELEWSGLLDFLDMQDGPVTRDQLLELLMNGGIKVDEVLLGGEGYLRNSTEHMDAIDMYGDDGPDLIEPTQFKSWSSDPQNDTYRELLITLPIGDGGNPDRAPSTHWDTEAVVAHARFAEKTDADGKRVLFIEEVQSDWHQKGRDQGYEEKVDPATVQAAQDKFDAAYAEYYGALDAIVNAGGPIFAEQLAKNPTIRGSTNRGLMGARAVAQRITTGDITGAQEMRSEIGREFYEMQRRVQDARQAADLAGRELDIAKGLITNGGIPNAPFKSTWPSLVMKRMIRWAVDHGYERVAWTTGEQQAERYNLSQSVGELVVQSLGDGTYYASTSNERAMDIVRQQIGAYPYTKDQLSEVFGRDIAIRATADADAAPIDTSAFGVTEAREAVTVTDLRVGGEGMKAFYDRNLVNITNDLIKKHGAKVGPVQLGNKLSVKERIEEAVAAAGEDQREYVTNLLTNTDFGSQVAADIATVNPGFDITPELAAAAGNGFPLFQNNGAPRGQVSFQPDITTAPSVITLLRGADLSTFIHESGHFFFEVLTDIASRADAPAEIVNDVRTLLNHTGVESLTKWQDMTTGERRVHHEEIARLFEAYIFTGNAPSLEMKGLFGRMKEWMKNVYRNLAALNVNLTPEVSGVFDRMLASDQEIEEAQADQGLSPFFKDKPEGLTDAEWAEYQAQGLEATQEAAGALERRSLRDMRYAGKTAARELKRLQREVSDRRAVVREEVVNELGSSPVYRAMRYLRTGKIDDNEPGEGPYKLYTPEVRELLRLGEDPMPGALSGMTSTENGVNPAQVAELFGFTSAHHMVNDLLFASPFNAAVDAETDQRMRERYGELADGEQLEAAVQGAIHNEVRGRFVATELAAMQGALGKRRVMNEAAKRIAKQMIDRIKLRNLRPGQFEAAERRAAKLAQKAGAGNLAEAATHKRNQLLQFHAAKAARDAVEEADKAREYLRKFGNKNTRAAIDKSFLDQIDRVLEQFELRQTSDRESDRRQELSKWIEAMREQGFEPMIDPEALKVLGRQAFRELTVAEMRDVVDAVKNIEFLGRQTKKMLTAIDKAELDQAAAEVVQSVTENAITTRTEIIGGKTWFERVQSNIADFFAMHRKFANVVYVMDGNKYGGRVWERFVRAMNAAGDTETRMNGEAGDRLSALFQMLKGEDLHTRRYVEAVDTSLRLEDIIAMGLNWGNEANRQRLLDGEKWDVDQMNEVLGALTTKHWDFIEAVWREIDSYWPQIKAKQERVTGVAPEKVLAEPFQVELDGELRLISGGYYPIKYDPDRSTKAEADTQAEVLRQITGGLYTNASTRRGHTKARAEKVERAVRKDFGVIFEHSAQVIHDLAWHETLIDMTRLLRHKGVDAAIRLHYGPETLRWMRKALEDIAVGDLPAQNGLERGLNYIRSGASIAGLGWNLWTSMLQPIGLTQSWSRIGIKHVGRGIADLFGSPNAMNAKVDWVYSVSPFMRSRGDTMQREINEIRNRVAEKGPLAKGVSRVISEPVADAISGSYFVLIAKAQLMADMPTFLGQYIKSMEAGEDEARAVALAEQAVIDSQGSGMIKDLAGVQKGNAWQKLWTNFYSYFSATYNLMSDRTQDLKRVGPADLPYYAVDIALLTFVPATLTSLMYQLLKGDDDDDGEDIAKNIAADNLNYLMGLMLGVREVGGAISGMAGYTGPAGARAFVELGKFGKQASQGEVDEALLRSTNSMAGVLLHYPSGQLDRTVRGLIAVSEGKGNAASPLVGPPPK